MQPKYFINSDNFKPGFVTPNDNWENRWRHGQNSPVSDFEPRAVRAAAQAPSRWATRSANSDQFAQCQVEKVFKAVCFRAPSTQPRIATAVRPSRGNFRSGGYKLKNVFAETAALLQESEGDRR